MAIKNDGLIRGKHIGNGLTTDETRKKIDVAVDGTTVTFTSDGKLQASGAPQAELEALDARVRALEDLIAQLVDVQDISGTPSFRAFPV